MRQYSVWDSGYVFKSPDKLIVQYLSKSDRGVMHPQAMRLTQDRSQDQDKCAMSEAMHIRYTCSV